MKNNKLTITLIFFLIVFSTGLYAQEMKDSTDKYFPDYITDADMKPVKTSEDNFSLKYGAWLTSTILDKTNETESNKTDFMSSVSIAKLWIDMSLFKNFQIYARGKDSYMSVIKHDNIPSEGLKTSDNQADLDVGYLAWTTDNKLLQISAGRKIFTLGSGVLFSGRADGGQVNLYTKIIDMKAFGAYTGYLDKDYNPYGLYSTEYSDGYKRTFIGGTISKSIFNQELFLMVLSQTDNGKELKGSETKHKYDSQYYGVGINGVFSDASYYAEYIIEKGTSYLKDTDNKKDINATAVVSGLTYYFDLMLKPTLLLNYAYGSGDDSRENANSPNGNISGFDTGFVYFGNYVGGYALQPYLQNIHIMRAGFSIMPFDMLDTTLLNRLSLSAKYSYYLKDKKNGAIKNMETKYGDDPDTDKHIGQGVDVSLRWKIFYDLSAFADYAVFMPGKAYTTDQKNITFIMAGVNLML